MDTKIKLNKAATADFLAARGYTITQAAVAVGVSASHLARVCAGERSATKELVRAILRLPKYHPIRSRAKRVAAI